MADEERFDPYDALDIEVRLDPAGGHYFIAVGHDPKAKVVTLVGRNGEPGKAVERKEFESWEIAK